MNDILRFIAIGNACPVCNNKMELKIGHALDGSHSGSIEWCCSMHSEGEGKLVYDLIAGLYFENVSYDQLTEIGEIVRAKRDIYELPNVEMKLKTFYDEPYRSMARIITEMSKEYGINVFNHVHDDAFDLGTWWRDVVSNMRDEDVKLWSVRLPGEEKSKVVHGMHAILEEETQKRACFDSLNGVRVMMQNGEVYEVKEGSLHKVVLENQVTRSKLHVSRI